MYYTVTQLLLQEREWNCSTAALVGKGFLFEKVSSLQLVTARTRLMADVCSIVCWCCSQTVLLVGKRLHHACKGKAFLASLV